MSADNALDSIFTIRFIGDQLDRRNLPIYELGQVLISIQRLFHKAYLAEHERLEKRAHPDKSERRVLALQIGAHEKRSDLYALIPFLTDPPTVAAFRTFSRLVMGGLASYSVREVLDRLRGKDNTKAQIYIGSIHAEVVNIVDRIDGLGGCDSIQIGCPRYDVGPTIEFDAKTRDYAHSITGQFYLGPVQRIQGAAFKLYPNLSMIEIRRRPRNKKCKLYLQPKDFERIRYGQVRSPLVTVTGRPRFKIGTERHSFDEFEVTSIDSVEDEGV